jgi:hypothetical protein
MRPGDKLVTAQIFAINLLRGEKRAAPNLMTWLTGQTYFLLASLSGVVYPGLIETAMT